MQNITAITDVYACKAADKSKLENMCKYMHRNAPNFSVCTYKYIPTEVVDTNRKLMICYTRIHIFNLMFKNIQLYH